MIQPYLGMWWAPCCLHDLQQIDSAEALAEFYSMVDDGLCRGMWPTRDAGLADLLPDEPTTPAGTASAQ